MNTGELRARLAKCLAITIELRLANRMSPEDRLRMYGEKGLALLLSKLQYGAGGLGRGGIAGIEG